MWKLKTTFCKYLTSIKFSTESTKVKQKEHEVSIGLQHENCYLVGVMKLWGF